MSEPTNVSRREFIKQGAVGASVGVAALSAASYARALGANDRIRIGIIGCGGIANSHRGELISIREKDNCEIVAVNDVWKHRATEYAEAVEKATGSKPKDYGDYTDMLAAKDIDKVTICTPEHWHAKMILDAIAAGKHVYTEKPMTHTIAESQAVVAAAKKAGTKAIVQVGVQGMSDDSYSSAHEYIQSGKLGKVVHAQIDYVRRYKDQDLGPWRTGHKSDEAKPADLDWKRWLGPATQREWDARRYYDWRCYTDYSGGIATDLFVHRITRLIKACGLKEPKSVCGFGGVYMWDDGRELPDNFDMVAEYEGGPMVNVLGTMSNQYGVDHCIRGYEGTLVFEGPGWRVHPANRPLKPGEKPIAEHKKTGAESQALHHMNHHQAIREGKPELIHCPVELGLYAVVAVNMANESYFKRAYLQWDDAKGTIAGA